MNIINTLEINNHKIQIYGTNEKPLFEANKLIVDILGYNKLGECRFYKDNKRDTDYIIKHDQYQAEGNLPPGQKGIKGLCNQHSNITIFLTEDGMYECLFASNKPFALEFRKQLRKLLTDIRIGNIELFIKKECQSTDIIKFKSNQIIQYIAKISDIEGQLKLLQQDNIKLQESNNTKQKIIEQTKKPLTIYEQRVDDKIYIRSTTRERSISNERNSKSPNKYIRNAAQNNKPITLTITNKQEIVSSDDRKYLVKQQINTINPVNLLNQRILNPNLSNVTIDTNSHNILQSITEHDNEDQDINQQSESNIYVDELASFNEYFADLYIDNQVIELKSYQDIDYARIKQNQAYKNLNTNQDPDMRLACELHQASYSLGHKRLLEKAPENFNDKELSDYKINLKQSVELFINLGKTTFKNYMSEVLDLKQNQQVFADLVEESDSKLRNNILVNYNFVDSKKIGRYTKIVDYIIKNNLHILDLKQLRQFNEMSNDFPSSVYNFLGIFKDKQRHQITIDKKRIDRYTLCRVVPSDQNVFVIETLKYDE